MSRLPRLNFPPAGFRISTQGETMRIWANGRGAWLTLTPEEWVRRHLVAYLVGHCGVPEALVGEECPVCVGGLTQRADVVVYDRDARPLLVAECKSPDVNIDAGVFAQVIRYNSVLNARYIAVTNGLKHFVHERGGDGGYTPLSGFPDLKA